MSKKPVSKPKKIGRPPKPIDLDTVTKMASTCCSIEEVATVLGESPSTLSQREDFTEAYQKGYTLAKRLLRSRMFEAAVKDKNTAMAIFLAKNILGMRDKPEEHSGEDTVHVSGFEFVTEDEAKKLEKARNKAAKDDE